MTSSASMPFELVGRLQSESRVVFHFLAMGESQIMYGVHCVKKILYTKLITVQLQEGTILSNL